MRLMFLFFLAIYCALPAAFGQNLIALQHNGAATFFTTIPAAVTAAASGDTIYLPGGSFPGFDIDKKLAIIGVGHHPDSTAATLKTIINGNFSINSNSSGSNIIGLELAGMVTLSQNCSGVIFERCHLKQGVYFEDGNLGHIFKENVIGSHYVYTGGGYSVGNYSLNHSSLPPTNCSFSNNIILGLIKNVEYSSIRNNIFFLSYYWNIVTGSFYSNLNYCVVENNIFNPTSPNGSNNIFRNNINHGVNGSDGFGNQGSNNILSVDFNTLFAQYTSPWDYFDDFYLANPAYNTGGTDGTPIGIYGGVYPWKDGSLPFNPHIQFKSIGSTTDPNGNLLINIQVKAQDH